jgi:hypothetical protein
MSVCIFRLRGNIRLATSEYKVQFSIQVSVLGREQFDLGMRVMTSLPPVAQCFSLARRFIDSPAHAASPPCVTGGAEHRRTSVLRRGQLSQMFADLGCVRRSGGKL